MKSFFIEIFAYHHHFNQKLIGELLQHLHVLPPRTFPLFCHVLNAHQVWNSRILNFEPFKVHQLHEIDACAAIDQKNHQDTLTIIEQADFDKTIHYTNTKNQPFSNTLRDILFHVANHTTHHRGQIISDFRAAGIEPLITDYIFYKR